MGLSTRLTLPNLGEKSIARLIPLERHTAIHTSCSSNSPTSIRVFKGATRSAVSPTILRARSHSHGLIITHSLSHARAARRQEGLGSHQPRLRLRGPPRRRVTRPPGNLAHRIRGSHPPFDSGQSDSTESPGAGLSCPWRSHGRVPVQRAQTVHSRDQRHPPCSALPPSRKFPSSQD